MKGAKQTQKTSLFLAQSIYLQEICQVASLRFLIIWLVPLALIDEKPLEQIATIRHPSSLPVL